MDSIVNYKWLSFEGLLPINIVDKSYIKEQNLNGAFPKKSELAPNQVSSGLLAGIKKNLK
jgi:hypothetical protein